MRLGRSRSAANITSMPETAHEERAIRMRNYAIAMAVRTLCFVALIWVRGPWMLVFAAGAIFLPYFAVVIANASRRRGPEAVERPDLLAIAAGEPEGPRSVAGAESRGRDAA